MLASANKTLKEGGLIDEDMTWSNYEAVIDNILTMNDKTLAAGRKDGAHHLGAGSQLQG